MKTFFDSLFNKMEAEPNITLIVGLGGIEGRKNLGNLRLGQAFAIVVDGNRDAATEPRDNHLNTSRL